MNDVPDLEHFFGRNLSYSEEKLPIYNKLQEYELSPFKDKDMYEIYTYAAVSGFKNNTSVKLQKSIPNISAAAIPRKHKAVLLSLVIQKAGDIDILFDDSKVKKIIDEFANGGIDLLESELIGDPHGADAITKMSSAMRTSIREWNGK